MVLSDEAEGTFMSMILCIDIGNTNIVWGVFEGLDLKANWRTATDWEKTGDEFGFHVLQGLEHFRIPKEAIQGIAISSVVPPLALPFQKMAKRYFNLEPEFAGKSLKIPMPVLTKHPEEVGSDLLVEAYAGYKMYGGPLLVLDFGTATTVSAVSKKGEFLGTAIAPGITISTEALFLKAAKLPRIEFSKPRTAIGKNTIHSMQSGFLHGFVGQVEKIIQMMKKELDPKTCVIATGGLAELIAGETPEITQVEPNLILFGLRDLHSFARR